MSHPFEKEAEDYAQSENAGSGYVQWHNGMASDIKTFLAGTNLGVTCEVVKAMRDIANDMLQTHYRLGLYQSDEMRRHELISRLEKALADYDELVGRLGI